jgi:hypothetical protein
VGVAVDEARHGQLPAGIDALPSVDLWRAGVEGLDDAVSHDDRRVLPEIDALPAVVEEHGASGDDEIG